MSKKDISKILLTGTPKQRLLLFIEDNTRYKYGLDRLLTDGDKNALANSFKKPNEIKLWNEWLKTDRAVSNAIMNLQGLKFEVLMHYSDLRGYILVWNSIENAELLVNSVLHEIKDPKERKRIAEDGAKGINLLFSKTYPDEEGYVEIKIDFEKDSYKDETGKLIGYKDQPKKTKEYSLWYVMNNVRKNATASAIKFLSWSQAILDYMEEEDFNVKTYKELINKMTEDVYRPIVGWTKYLSDQKYFIADIPHKRADKLKSKYNITPTIEEIQVIDLDIYNDFKNNYLRDE